MRTAILLLLSMALTACANPTTGERVHPEHYYQFEATRMDGPAAMTVELTCNRLGLKPGMAWQDRTTLETEVDYLDLRKAAPSVIVLNTQHEEIGTISGGVILDRSRMTLEVPEAVALQAPLLFLLEAGKVAIDYYPGYVHLYASESFPSVD